MYITGKVLVPIRCLGAPTHLLYYFLCLTRNVHWMMLKDMRVALVSIFSVLQLDFIECRRHIQNFHQDIFLRHLLFQIFHRPIGACLFRKVSFLFTKEISNNPEEDLKKLTINSIYLSNTCTDKLLSQSRIFVEKIGNIITRNCNVCMQNSNFS